jgi:membrane protein YqaA with SNARE-associated domain
MEAGPWWVEHGLLGLFLASFLAATVLPFSSEAVLAAMAFGPWSGMGLWLAASLGNTLGGLTSYGLGRLGDLERIARWLRTPPAKAARWQGLIQRHGIWAALLTWLPFVGDPIAIALGLGRTAFWPTSLLMFAGKAARYAVVLAMLRGWWPAT